MAVSDEAIPRIREMITSGDLRTAGRLPPEKELSERRTGCGTLQREG